MGAQELFCAICGGPQMKGNTSKGKPEEWLGNAVLLTTAHETESGIELDKYFPHTTPPYSTYVFHLEPNPSEEAQRRVLRLDAHAVNVYGRFSLVPSGQIVYAFHVDFVETGPGPVTRGAPLYIPIHKLCFQLAEHFIDAVERRTEMLGEVPPSDSVASHKKLWEVLSHRLHGTRSMQARRIDEPHDYLGGRLCRNVYWEAKDDSLYGELLEANPINISNLTTSVLQNLKPTSALDSLEDVIQSELEMSTDQTADPEVYHNLHNADAGCDYTRSQDWWCDALIGGTILPWLWDLDVDLVRAKQRASRWNWELLTRQLSQIHIYKPEDTSLSLPVSLRNRRRIWRLLEEARVDDIAKACGTTM